MIYIIIEIRGISVVGIGILVSRLMGMVAEVGMGMGMGMDMDKGKAIRGNLPSMPPGPVSMTCQLIPSSMKRR